MAKTNLPVPIPASDLLEDLTSDDELAIHTAEAMATVVKLHILDARRHALQAALVTANLRAMVQAVAPLERGQGRPRKVRP